MVKIELKNVNKRFGSDVTVLKDVNLNIKDGEFMVLVGPSGCGKSTCLNLIAGLEFVSTGKIIFGDADVTYLSPKERKVAMVFQSYALYPHMTVRDNMSFSLKLEGVDSDIINNRVKKAAELLGIPNLLDRKPKELSGGQRQRVALGRCIVRNPTAFLFDEPLSNLDAKLRIQMRGEIIKLQRQLGVTLIYVTHDQVEAMSMADRIAILYDTKFQQIGTPTEVYNTPRNKFVASFIGSPQMNFFDASLGNGGITFGDQSFSLSQENINKIKQANKDDLILGIRPEHINISPERRSEAFEIEITVIEFLGADTMITFKFEDEMTGMATSPGYYNGKIGDKAYISFKENDIHIFDKDTEINIIHHPID
ncbi:MAG: sn-glycerol-3-phosphate ABC transporter ATP-binding protein UgpC [Candidatus Lokiarchaeota archaeon]|nr:sn-glycerol-3-phosphate ABC transporter ATP-binding protein UgpC [Candidatus Lokiarchaeota archaeon]MBD3202568.1 sn-glycerol-3-phosphate ABC transporter ATP-binding protein UgpC [Candidatus Lokiarchaeota archaeon]